METIAQFVAAKFRRHDTAPLERNLAANFMDQKHKVEFAAVVSVERIASVFLRDAFQFRFQSAYQARKIFIPNHHGFEFIGVDDKQKGPNSILRDIIKR